MGNTTERATTMFTQSRQSTTTRKLSSRKRLLTPLVCSVCAMTGIFGGVGSLILGLLFVLISAISGERSYDRTGTVLLIVAIPAILIGAIFLDEIKEEE